MKPGTLVQYASDVTSHKLPPGKVIYHEAAGIEPCSPSDVLVRWTRNDLMWVDVEDLMEVDNSETQE